MKTTLEDKLSEMHDMELHKDSMLLPFICSACGVRNNYWPHECQSCETKAMMQEE